MYNDSNAPQSISALMMSWDWPDANDRTLLRAVDTLPFVLMLYTQAVLVVLPAPRLVRAALLPLTLYYAWNLGSRYNFVRTIASPLVKVGYNPERVGYLHFLFTVTCVILACRAIEFTLVPGYRRYDPPIGDAPPLKRPSTIGYVFCDAFELCTNVRGIGCIFDSSRPPLARTALALTHTAITGLMIIRGLQAVYEAGALISRMLLGLEDWQWPRLFDSPWLATSLAGFWARRWHQCLRAIFVVTGAQPAAKIGRLVGGKQGEAVLGVMGAFGVSAVLHVFGLWGMGKGFDFWQMGGFFLMQGVGVLLEAVSPIKPSGVAGWWWTMGWTLGWGTQMIDAWAKAGLLASDYLPGWASPSVWLLERIPAYFSG
ncbi:unnamed protein product [Peniophora sp. CBMAI 1063]|nr:unnamed protein product [Peniophora sp. CBMAI 1063]